MKVCDNCQKEFVPHKQTGSRQRFCSDECSRAWWKRNRDKKKRYEYICRYCGETYLAKEKNRNKYCSAQCASDDLKKEKICLNCGKKFWGKNTKHCSDQCKELHLYKHKCIICGMDFETKGNNAKYCSDECKKEKARQYSREYDKQNHLSVEIKCRECGKIFIVNYGDKRKIYCSSECGDKFKKKTEVYKAQRKRMSRSRRARLKGANTIPYNDSEIFGRDGWKCQVCGQQVNKELRFPHYMSATIDHIIPLSKNGSDAPINVQLAHFICNSYKRDIVEQDVCIPGV